MSNTTSTAHPDSPAPDDQTRREMLAAIRAQLALSAPHDAVRHQHEMRRAAAPPAINPSTLDRQTDAVPEDVVEHFRAALEAVGGQCAIVADLRTAAIAVDQILERTRARRVGVSGSSLVQSVLDQLPAGAQLFVNADAPTLFDCDVGLTSAQWAIAETGTLVLESDQERHRLTSLVPTAHIAIVRARQMRQTLGEVLALISAQGADALSRTVTFITGPSRTSDIELTLAIGVHGPAELYVIVIEDAVV